MIGTDLHLVSNMPIRIRWAKVLALHAKYHADESSHEYLAQCFVDQLQEALKQHQMQCGRDGEGDSIEESDVLAGDDAFIITGAPDLTFSLDKITCFDDFFNWADRFTGDDAAAEMIRPAHELRAQLFILQNIPVACRPASVTFVMDLARFRTMRRRLAVWHDGMTHYIMPLRAMVDRLARRHHQTRQLERQTRERLLLGHSQDRAQRHPKSSVCL